MMNNRDSWFDEFDNRGNFDDNRSFNNGNGCNGNRLIDNGSCCGDDFEDDLVWITREELQRLRRRSCQCFRRGLRLGSSRGDCGF